MLLCTHFHATTYRESTNTPTQTNAELWCFIQGSSCSSEGNVNENGIRLRELSDILIVLCKWAIAHFIFFSPSSGHGLIPASLLFCRKGSTLRTPPHRCAQGAKSCRSLCRRDIMHGHGYTLHVIYGSMWPNNDLCDAPLKQTPAKTTTVFS